MTDMIERVADAIISQVLMLRHDTYHSTFLDSARAAIAAMREPTEKMIDAGSKEQQNILSKPIEGIWTAMIDAALECSTKSDGQ